MANLLTSDEAANFLRCPSDDPVMIQLLPLVDKFVQNATGRDWTQDLEIDGVARAAAMMLIVLWYDNPGQMQTGSETVLPFGLTNALAQLEAEALKYRKYQFEGLSGAGDIYLPGALMGDDVISLVGVYGVTGDQSSSFESEISDAGYIAQTSGSDLTDKLFVVILKSPAGAVVA